MTILLPVLAGIGCILSFLLMLKDADNQKKTRENFSEQTAEQDGQIALLWEGGIPKSCWIYSAVCLLVTVAIGVVLPNLYPGNGIWGNIKRIVLLFVIWPLAYIDYKTMRIPNLFVVYGLICRAVLLLFELFLGHTAVWNYLATEAIAAVALLLAAVLCGLVVKNGIGFGDMKLFVVLGLFLGLTGIWSAIFLALLISFVIALFVLITKKKSRKDAIPFGPALVIGTYLSICLSGM